MEPLDHFFPSSTSLLVEKAIEAFEARRFGDSYAICNKVSALTPDDVDAHVLRAFIAAASDCPVDAMQSAYHAFKCRPKYPDKHGQIPGSRKAIAEFIKRTYETAEADQQFSNDPPWFRMIYGIACQTLGEFDKAREIYKRSLDCSRLKFDTICFLDALERAEDNRLDREQVFDFENHIFLKNFRQQEGDERLHDLHVELYDDVRRAHSLKQEIHFEAPYAKWVTGNLANVPKEGFQELKTKIATEVDGIIGSLTPQPGHPFLGCIPKSYELEIFGALLGPGGYHSPHVHSEAWLSGGYYVQVPNLRDREKDDHAACIEFGRCFLGDTDNFETNVKLIQPQEGMLLMWPSYYVHNTVPCQNQRERLTIGINVYPNHTSYMASLG